MPHSRFADPADTFSVKVEKSFKTYSNLCNPTPSRRIQATSLINLVGFVESLKV